MKLQKILYRLQKLHPKEIDLSLDRIKKLCQKLGNPQDKIKSISVVGTNGKQSTINAIFYILKENGVKCNVYTSPHIKKINERFVFNNEELEDEKLGYLFEEVEKINNKEPITFFEILTACYLYKAAEYPENINLIEAGLFHRFDATNVLKNNLASVVCPISKDHLDCLPIEKQTINQIVHEKTSNLLNSNIIVSKQNSIETTEYIKKTIATLRVLDFDIGDEDIKNGIKKIKNIARLQEIKSGKLKDLIKDNRLLLDGSHNEDSSRVLNEYLMTLDCDKHLIVGMMANKDHKKYISYFKNFSSFTTIDIPNQPNAISGIELKQKFQDLPNIQYKESIEQAIKSIPLKKNDLLVIAGSLYLSGEFLKLN